MESNMNREKYEELLNYLNDNILKEWDKRKLRNLSKESEKFEAKYGLLLWKKKNGQILRVLKEDEIDSVIFMIHNHPTGGHLGKDTVYDKISTRFWWKGMYKDIERYLKTCDSCQRRGNKGGTGYLNPIKVRQPFEKIGIDFVGPLERTKKGNRYGVSAGKKYQIDKKFFFQITNVLNQITNFTSFLLKNIFLKKISIWYFFPALTPYAGNPVRCTMVLFIGPG